MCVRMRRRVDIVTNILFVPLGDDVEKLHRNFFTHNPPVNPGVGTLRFSVLSVERKSLAKANSPR